MSMLEIAWQGSSVVEQRTHKPLVVGSNPTPATRTSQNLQPRQIGALSRWSPRFVGAQNTIVMSNISFEEFKKLDLRIGKVISAEKIVGSINLLKLEIDLGDPSTGSGLGKRQILAGISKYYDPKKLVGMNLVIVTNLEPKKMMGLESKGMILCAEDKNGEPVCLTPLKKDVLPGSKVL